MSTNHIPKDLHGFSGGYELSECHIHWTRRGFHTPGVHALAEAAGCHWLIDAIMSYQGQRKVVNEGHLQTWQLVKNGERKATLKLTHDDKTILKQEIDFTDFPFQDTDEGKFSLWVTDCTYQSASTGQLVNAKMVILPDEY